MFEYLKKLEVDVAKTITYTIEEIPGEPVLHLLPATSANKPYFNAILRNSKKEVKGAKKGKKKKVDVAALSEAREADRKDYPGKVVVGWENVPDAQGNDVPFTVEACGEFLTALPDWLFDRIRDTASVPGNFSEGFECDEDGELSFQKK